MEETVNTKPWNGMDKGRLWTRIHLSNWCKKARVSLPAKQKAKLLTVAFAAKLRLIARRQARELEKSLRSIATWSMS